MLCFVVMLIVSIIISGSDFFCLLLLDVWLQTIQCHGRIGMSSGFGCNFFGIEKADAKVQPQRDKSCSIPGNLTDLFLSFGLHI